ncbi:uncharacterized protein L969DRAFT_49982 [Mixia osmundae IAM 14324]|uniref:Uncharacterized protein n=1 Tax=Mixia osmundae (strain CBS 9802 / IAM 14324 / JCM 22182 / KY 12970) TaxID=764103 RepID=G7E6M2_MIXOS|nr:uncharacterized protein L969DRAFT_49982 [Mixia osmundae IAM 14324]KEI39140.1 hypothetical protein L969DRAFT_49982 [Mixia osmundae IAM 14324]GAA98482.1 hypothetical protein E5Q_05168 [Mixia osmundae IAM 14324]
MADCDVSSFPRGQLPNLATPCAARASFEGLHEPTYAGPLLRLAATIDARCRVARHGVTSSGEERTQVVASTCPQALIQSILNVEQLGPIDLVDNAVTLDNTAELRPVYFPDEATVRDCCRLVYSSIVSFQALKGAEPADTLAHVLTERPRAAHTSLNSFAVRCFGQDQSTACHGQEDIDYILPESSSDCSTCQLTWMSYHYGRGY